MMKEVGLAKAQRIKRLSKLYKLAKIPFKLSEVENMSRAELDKNIRKLCNRPKPKPQPTNDYYSQYDKMQETRKRNSIKKRIKLKLFEKEIMIKNLERKITKNRVAVAISSFNCRIDPSFAFEEDSDYHLSIIDQIKQLEKEIQELKEIQGDQS